MLINPLLALASVRSGTVSKCFPNIVTSLLQVLPTTIKKNLGWSSHVLPIASTPVPQGLGFNDGQPLAFKSLTVMLGKVPGGLLETELRVTPCLWISS